MAATSSSTNNAVVWQNLVQWIQSNGGYVHPSLELRTTTTTSTKNNGEYRGVFCKQAIANDETLIRLPRDLAVSGQDKPSRYSPNNNNKKEGNPSSRDQIMTAASPWLRCLAAYYAAVNPKKVSKEDGVMSSSNDNNSDFHKCEDWSAYIASLPNCYETVSSWTEDEISTYLAGTTTQGGTGVSWSSLDTTALQERYTQQIRPYLVCCNVLLPDDIMSSLGRLDLLDEEMQSFSKACQCLSTRCFHMNNIMETAIAGHRNEKAGSGGSDDDDNVYTGPFLLPVIDLLNHSSVPGQRCTTLRSEPQTFVMQAERDMMQDEEVLHSYGTSLTACQFLQTFGFVPLSAMERMATVLPATSDESISNMATDGTLSPALLSKTSILEACWQVIESGTTKRIAQTMKERDMEDEIWEVKVDRSRCADFMMDHFLVEKTSPLTDEIVTLACLPFLPTCAYQEASQALLGKEILQDYFLGQLVCASVLQALRAKLAAYTPILWQGQMYNNDRVLLHELLQQWDHTKTSDDQGLLISRHRLMYGLTVRLEEKTCLEGLRQEIMDALAFLEEDDDASEMKLPYTVGRYEDDGDQNRSKKQRI